MLPQRYVGVLFEDSFPEFHFDDSPDRQQLRRQLNDLLDAYHELKSLALDTKADEPGLLPAELDEDERIEQVAARFIEIHDWPLTALPLVKDIFHQLGAAFGSEKVSLINGSMTHTERRAAIEQFEGQGQFLISTEAGVRGLTCSAVVTS